MVTILNQWGETWLLYFGPLVLQNTLFLGLVLLALHLLRQAPARIKYLIGMVGLGKLLIPAFIPVPILNSPAMPSMAIGDISLAAPLAVTSSPVAQPILPNYQALLLLLWAGVAVIVFLVPFFSLIRLKARLRSAVPIMNDNNTENAAVNIYRCDKIAVPLTVGFFPNRLYVPEAWISWNSEQRRMIIEHELAHIRRRDGLVGLVQVLVQAVYAFHPLVWLLNRRMNELREMACDDAIVKENKGTSLSYSRFLADVAAGIAVTQPGCISTATLIRQKNDLLKRVKYQLEDTMRKYSRLRAGLLMVALFAMILPLSLTCTNPRVDSPTPDTTTDDLPETYALHQNYPNPFRTSTTLRFDLPEATDVQIVVYDQQEREVARLVDQHLEAGHHTVLWDGQNRNGNVLPDGRYDVLMASPRFTESITMVMLRDGYQEPEAEEASGIDVERILELVMPTPEGGFEAIMANVVYPEAARRAGLEGKVVLKLTVNTDGEIQTIEILETTFDNDLGLHQAAIDAVRSVEWNRSLLADFFKEAQGDYTLEIPIVFTLDEANGNNQPGTSSQTEPVTGEIHGTVSMESTELDFSMNQTTLIGSGRTATPQPPQESGYMTDFSFAVLKFFEWGSSLQENVIYPESAREDGIEGTVWVKATVTKEGIVTEASAIPAKSNTNDPRLIEAAINAVRRTTLEQSENPDYQVGMNVEVPVEFRLEEANGNDQSGSSSQAAPVTGKIYGTVTDGQTGEPLPAANITLDGTTLGAATDNNGQYFITNIPPGNYSLRANFLGFESVVYDEVIVKVMESTEINFSLREVVVNIDHGAVTPQSAPEDENLADYSFPFIPYEARPEPIGGPAAIQENVIYPESAREAGIEGTVYVQAILNPEGIVTRASAVAFEGETPDPRLSEAAVNAIRHTQFSPAIQRDRYISVNILVPVEFKIDQ